MSLYIYTPFCHLRNNWWMWVWTSVFRVGYQVCPIAKVTGCFFCYSMAKSCPVTCAQWRCHGCQVSCSPNSAIWDKLYGKQCRVCCLFWNVQRRHHLHIVMWTWTGPRPTSTCVYFELVIHNYNHSYQNNLPHHIVSTTGPASTLLSAI